MENDNFGTLLSKVDTFIQECRNGFNEVKTVVSVLQDRYVSSEKRITETPAINQPTQVSNINEPSQVAKKSYAETIQENQVHPNCIIKVRVTLTDDAKKNWMKTYEDY